MDSMKCEICGHTFNFRNSTFEGAGERINHFQVAHEKRLGKLKTRKDTEMPKDKPTSLEEYADDWDKLPKNEKEWAYIASLCLVGSASAISANTSAMHIYRIGRLAGHIPIERRIEMLITLCDLGRLAVRFNSNDVMED